MDRQPSKPNAVGSNPSRRAALSRKYYLLRLQLGLPPNRARAEGLRISQIARFVARGQMTWADAQRRLVGGRCCHE